MWNASNKKGAHGELTEGIESCKWHKIGLEGWMRWDWNWQDLKDISVNVIYRKSLPMFNNIVWNENMTDMHFKFYNK